MNNVQLVGRLTADPEVRYTTGENSMATCRFSVAVQRSYKNAEGVYEADFPACCAFRQTAEFINKFFHKGDMIGITGHIQTGSYTNKDGNKVYTTDVMVDKAEFVGSKNPNGATTQPKPQANPQSSANADWMNVPDEEDLPF